MNSKRFVVVCLPVAERRLGAAGSETGRLQTGGQVHPGEEVGEEGEAEDKNWQRREDRQGPHEGPYEGPGAGERRRSGRFQVSTEILWKPAEVEQKLNVLHRRDGGSDQEGEEERTEEESEAEEEGSHLTSLIQIKRAPGLFVIRSDPAFALRIFPVI